MHLRFSDSSAVQEYVALVLKGGGTLDGADTRASRRLFVSIRNFVRCGNSLLRQRLTRVQQGFFLETGSKKLSVDTHPQGLRPHTPGRNFESAP